MSRHGHPRRLRNVSAAVETGSGRCDAAAQSRNERGNQRQNGHDEQYQYSTSESISEASRVQTTLDQRNEKGEFRSFTSDLHLWMQAWSGQGEQMLASVESVDRLDNNVTAFDYSDEEFRSIEASLY